MGLLTPPEPSGGPPNPSQTYGWAFQSLPDLLLGHQTPAEPPGGPFNPSRKFKWVSQHLPDLRVGLPISVGPPGGPADPTWTFGLAFQTIPNVWQRLGGFPRGLGGLGGPPRGLGRVRRSTWGYGWSRGAHPEIWAATWRIRRCQETHTEVWETHWEVQEWLEEPPGHLKGVGRPTQRFERGRVHHPKTQTGLAPPRGPGGVGRPTQRCGRVWKAHEIEVRSSTQPNCLNYRVLARRRIIGSRIFHEFRVLKSKPNCLN